MIIAIFGSVCASRGFSSKKSVLRDLECSICGEQSSNNMSFVAHLCSHFEDDLNYVSPFDKHFRRCSACHEEFSTPFQMFLHQDQRHMLDLGEYACRICQEHFGSLVDLFTHLNNVHPSIDMPYHCDRCFYRTSMYEDMTHHIRQVELRSPCSSTFSVRVSDASRDAVFLLSVLFSIGVTPIDSLYEFAQFDAGLSSCDSSFRSHRKFQQTATTHRIVFQVLPSLRSPRQIAERTSSTAPFNQQQQIDR